jgi:hypothetical protein
VPPFCLHLSIADEAIERLHNPVISGNRGSYYLGSTAPDIRFFISASREETHFLSLESEDGASGIQAMFEAYPELAETSSLSDATKSFIAGYLSHLVTDESWIYLIYRPYFGLSSPLRGDPMANFLDRVLQFELDRRERVNNNSISEIREQLADSTSGVEISFIDNANLTRWREFVSIATARRRHWEDFRHFAGRYLTWMRQIPAQEIESFFASLDSRLEQLLEMIPEERLQAFRRQSVNDSVKVAREYLG